MVIFLFSIPVTTSSKWVGKSRYLKYAFTFLGLLGWIKEYFLIYNVFLSVQINVVQSMPAIRTLLGVEEYVLISGILITGIDCISKTFSTVTVFSFITYIIITSAFAC